MREPPCHRSGCENPNSVHSTALWRRPLHPAVESAPRTDLAPLFRCNWRSTALKPWPPASPGTDLLLEAANQGLLLPGHCAGAPCTTESPLTDICILGTAGTRLGRSPCAVASISPPARSWQVMVTCAPKEPCRRPPCTCSASLWHACREPPAAAPACAASSTAVRSAPFAYSSRTKLVQPAKTTKRKAIPAAPTTTVDPRSQPPNRTGRTAPCEEGPASERSATSRRRRRRRRWRSWGRAVSGREWGD